MAKLGFKTSKLMTAIRANSLNGVIEALEEGDDVEEADIHGFGGLPLRTACFEGNLPIIRELLTHGANVNALGSSGTGMPLRLALRGGHRTIAALLIKQGASIPSDLVIDDELMHGAALTEALPSTPDHVDLLLDEPATPAHEVKNSEPASNIIEFETSAIQSAIEEVHVRSCYGTDTNLLTMDLMRFNDEREEATQQKDQENPAEPPKPSFWQSGKSEG
ncbi:hypothetical protein GBK02_12760 [Dechloromonas sp. TW-R-39-2]|nr:hypothetical protein GBK02_12760 [Dechloromonas sp. TW-R-39-2]